jgi:hypothetical protein
VHIYTDLLYVASLVTYGLWLVPLFKTYLRGLSDFRTALVMLGLFLLVFGTIRLCFVLGADPAWLTQGDPRWLTQTDPEWLGQGDPSPSVGLPAANSLGEP